MRNQQLVKYFEKYSVCNMSLKQLSNILDEYFVKGDELSIIDIIKYQIHCIPENIFRYLLLFISDYEKKMKIYYYAIKQERFDLLKNIKGLRIMDYKKILEKIHKENQKQILISDLEKAMKKEKQVKQSISRDTYLKKHYKKISGNLYI
jgi:hypothetical protein